MPDIIIKVSQDTAGQDAFAVHHGRLYVQNLTFDEMLGLVASLTMPQKRPCLQWLRTKKQHKERQRLFARAT